MTPSNTIVGIELGTSKVCVLVAKADERDGLKIIGIGQSKSHGIRKAEVSDPTLAANDLEIALDKAEEMSGVDISRAYLGVSGRHVKGATNRGLHPIKSRERGVTPKDMEIVVKNARSFELDESYNRLHDIQQNYKVDDMENIKNPIGVKGHNLMVEMHVIQGAYNRIENSIQVVRQNNVDVQEVAFNGLASALACLGKREKEHGALVIDIGGGTTDYLLYAGGRVRHSGVISVGGDHVSNDIAVGMEVSVGAAEDLKLNHGSAILLPDAEKRRVSLSSGIEKLTRDFSLNSIQQIMNLRLTEIFELIKNDLEKKQLIHHCQAGVVLCGGTAKTPHIEFLAERIFNARCSRGSAKAMPSIHEKIDTPEFLTCLGILKFGSFQIRGKKRPVSSFPIAPFSMAIPGLFKKEAANN